MYQIAICDDDSKELDKTEDYLKSWQETHQNPALQINRFENVKELLSLIQRGEYLPNLLFLDIYMPQESGIDAARELRQMGNDCRLVFLTLSKEHALEAFGVNADQYLVKPVEKDVLFSVLDRLFENLEKKQQNYVLLRIDGKNCKISIKDIVFCEAQGKNQRMYLADGTCILLHMTMTEIYKMIAERKEFVKVGVSYIVNLEHINSLNGQKIFLDIGKNIFLPRGAYQPLRKQYFAYYCEE